MTELTMNSAAWNVKIQRNKQRIKLVKRKFVKTLKTMLISNVLYKQNMPTPLKVFQERA